MVWSDVTSAFPLDPALKAVTAGETYISWAQARVAGLASVDRYTEILIHLAAHYGTVYSAGGSEMASGPVTAHKAGEYSKNYGAYSGVGFTDLISTGYGRTAAEIIRSQGRKMLPRSI